LELFFVIWFANDSLETNSAFKTKFFSLINKFVKYRVDITSAVVGSYEVSVGDVPLNCEIQGIYILDKNCCRKNFKMSIAKSNQEPIRKP